MVALKKCVAIYPPMLDLFFNVNADFLEANEIEPNAIVGYSTEKHQKLHEGMMALLENGEKPIVFRAGGATFNTQKVLSQWMDCYFFGIVGSDRYGEIIEQKMQGTAVNICLDKRERFSTAWAYVFICGDKRANLAYQDKSVCYSSGAKEKICSLISKDTVFYFVSFMFFLDNVVSDCIELYKKKNEIGFCSVVNLSSEEIARMFRPRILEIIKMSDFIIGNKEEYFALSGCTDIDSLLAWLDTLGVAYAITDGPGEVLGKAPGGPLRKTLPFNVPADSVTNGAGDSFAAGFIGGLEGCTNPAGITDILPLLEKGASASYSHIKSLKKGLAS
ncbi:adenosine kinase [Nematocida major]|uniref:adenosine kinase n=1 Tax=Nematocida major TaxID=1912982 RepID=UPI002007CD90|nr:adenosine kinase [Nematocida major]KAH9386288.1 adenosine kinase [Nematocida major]